MPMPMKKASLRCCTCGPGGCQVGCCWPATDGVLQSMNYSISAPSCTNIDGKTGIFVPVDPTNQPLGSCGYCACYTSGTPLAILGTLWQVFGPMCLPQACGANLCFGITCDADEQSEAGPSDAVDPCCSRLRLLVAASSPVRIAVTGESGVITDCGTSSLAVCSSDPDGWIQLAPMSCTCNEDGSLSVEWDLSVLEFYCTGTIVGGPCDGKPDCCKLDCDLTGATLVI